MGKYDSSRTRVVPVFNYLANAKGKETTWPMPLLRLGSHSAQKLDFDPGHLTSGQQRWWGKNERRLDPPRGLLNWLAENASEPSSDKMWGADATRKKRKQLIARDPTTVAEAIRLLKIRTRPGVWYVLEGKSAPDVFIETTNALIVVEGKRTERKATSSTTWMPKRSQMLRHMDAAWEIRGAKRVLGLMIVEGDGDADAISVSPHWANQAKVQVLEQTLRDSLPHRSFEERRQIAAGFLGVTTWQRVCAAFSIDWPPTDRNIPGD
jgi:hypothetical protein